MIEEWRPVIGHEGRYEVSNMGRVKRLAPSVKILAFRGGKYPMTTLLHPTRHVSNHTLVLETFVGPCPPRHECRHLDDNKRNPRLDNLSWGTRGENNRDRKRHGSAKNYKLTPADVKAIRCLLPWMTNTEIAADFGVTQATIWWVRKGLMHADV